MGRQDIIYSDITRGGGKTHTPHSVTCYKSILHMGFHTSQSNLLKKALIIVKLIAHNVGFSQYFRRILLIYMLKACWKNIENPVVSIWKIKIHSNNVQ